MPYSFPNNVPRPAKNWTEAEQRKCVAAANAVLDREGWEGANDEKRKEIEREAIFACISGAGKSTKSATEMHELLVTEMARRGLPHETMRSVSGTHTQSEASDLLGLDRCRQIVYGVVLVPEEEDEDGYCVSALEIEKAAHKFLAGQRQVWLRHKSKVTQANVVESYCAPVDLTFDDAFGLQRVPKGSWIVGVHVADPGVWQEIANGTLRGLSLRALVSIQEEESV